MRQHIASHWRVWVGVAIVVVALNEIVDRSFFDHREHIDGDVVLTVVVLLLTITSSYAVTRLRARRQPT
jgi:hypothetical protein